MPVLLGAEETRETFAGLETWQIVLWYVLIAVSVAIFFFGVARLALKYRRGRTKAPVGNPLQRAVRDDEDRRHARLDPPARPALGPRPPARLLRLRRPLHRDGHPRLPGRLRRARARLGLLAGLVLPRLLALPRRLRLRADRRPERVRGQARRPAAVPALLLASGRGGGAARGRGEALPPRRLALPRQPALPRAHRLPARVLPHRRRRPVLREVGAVRLAGRPGVHRGGLRRRGGRVGPRGHLVGARRLRALLGLLDPVHEGGAHARRARPASR